MTVLRSPRGFAALVQGVIAVAVAAVVASATQWGVPAELPGWIPLIVLGSIFGGMLVMIASPPPSPAVRRVSALACGGLVIVTLWVSAVVFYRSHDVCTAHIPVLEPVQISRSFNPVTSNVTCTYTTEADDVYQHSWGAWDVLAPNSP